METIIDKIYDIMLVIQTLDENEKHEFLEESQIPINNINDNLIEIKNKLLSPGLLKDNDLSEKIHNVLDINERRQCLVERSIFPYYWAIDEQINKLNDEQLDEIEKKLDSGELFKIIDIHQN